MFCDWRSRSGDQQALYLVRTCRLDEDYDPRTIANSRPIKFKKSMRALELASRKKQDASRRRPWRAKEEWRNAKEAVELPERAVPVATGASEPPPPVNRRLPVYSVRNFARRANSSAERDARTDTKVSATPSCNRFRFALLIWLHPCFSSCSSSNAYSRRASATAVPTRWSCRTGVCHTCETSLISGTVRYRPDPIDMPADGNVLICCSQPEGDVVIDL